jgi:hypothetical protein
MRTTIDASPNASSLLSSMRCIGYSFNDAVADIIDNSITANSSTIKVDCLWKDEHPYVRISDDGCGMSLETLRNAMRLGSRSPLEHRDAGDLGRFGLGLKTASFSQSKSLRVTTWRANGEACIVNWNLDSQPDESGWILDVDTEPSLTKETSSGTVVEWMKLDGIGERGHDIAEQHFNNMIGELERHLGTIFHRYIDGAQSKRITICVNGIECHSRNPFFVQKSRTSPMEIIEDGQHQYKILSYTLPHMSKCTEREWAENQGPHGYMESQGFYLYRNNRLIVMGTWFGLAKRKESTKLCRVSIDMESGSDHKWNIDVKKSHASPPPIARKRLRQLIESLTKPSRQTQLHRTRSLSNEQIVPVWKRVVKDGGIQYVLNDEHPVMTQLKASLNDDQTQRVAKFLQIVVNTLPVKAIYQDYKDDETGIDQPKVDIKDLISHARQTKRYLVENGYTDEQIVRVMKSNELFRLRWQEIESSL